MLSPTEIHDLNKKLDEYLLDFISLTSERGGNVNLIMKNSIARIILICATKIKNNLRKEIDATPDQFMIFLIESIDEVKTELQSLLVSRGRNVQLSTIF